MLIAVVVLMAAFPLLGIAVHVLRGFVHERRERRYGLGGTQDIAMWGTLVMFLWLVATFTCLGIAINRGELPPR